MLKSLINTLLLVSIGKQELKFESSISQTHAAPFSCITKSRTLTLASYLSERFCQVLHLHTYNAV